MDGGFQLMNDLETTAHINYDDSFQFIRTRRVPTFWYVSWGLGNMFEFSKRAFSLSYRGSMC